MKHQFAGSIRIPASLAVCQLRGERLHGVDSQLSADGLVRWLPHYSIDGGRVRLFGIADTGIGAPDSLTRLIQDSTACTRAEFTEAAGEELLGVLTRAGAVVEYSRRPMSQSQLGGILIVEPHIDDFALSCSGTVAALQQADGCDVCCLTVFGEYSSAGFPWRERVPLTNRQYTLLRRAEAEIAAEYFGMQSELFSFADSLLRGIRLGVRARGPVRKKDIRLIEKITERLAAAFARRRPRYIFVPAAIGWHYDHRIVHVASSQALDAISYTGQVVLYEDYPYCDEGRYSCWGRLAEIFEVSEIRPCYTQIDRTAELKARLISIYRSQFPDSRIERILRETRQFARATNIEGRLGRHFEGAHTFLAERTWWVEDRLRSL